MRNHQALFEHAKSGDRVALGQLFSLLENHPKTTLELIQKNGCIHHDKVVMGVTGSPGAGKSTLIGSLLSLWAKAGKKVAILAVDPSSPFSGGAVLGDRIRMLNNAQDGNIIIRSLGTRGYLGGIAACIVEIVEVLIAMGIDIILVETAGAGQIDVEVAEVTDTTVVVLYPGWGDAMQVAKAGIMEIADVYVVNKKDLPGADTAAKDIELMLEYRQESAWTPIVMQTSAASGEGIEDLWQAVCDHQKFLSDTGERNKRRQHHLAYLIRRMAMAQLSSTWHKSSLLGLADSVMNEETDFRLATAKALEELQNDVCAVLKKTP